MMLDTGREAHSTPDGFRGSVHKLTAAKAIWSAVGLTAGDRHHFCVSS